MTTGLDHRWPRFLDDADEPPHTSDLMQRPDTRYARTHDGVEIAYQRYGDGPRDLVWLPHFLFDLDLWWDCEPVARWLEGLASVGTVLIRDIRGTGLSDRSVEPGDIGTDISDLLAVMDHEGIGRAALVGNLRGAGMAAFMAAMHPDRVSELILWNPSARAARAPDYPGVPRGGHRHRAGRAVDAVGDRCRRYEPRERRGPDGRCGPVLPALDGSDDAQRRHADSSTRPVGSDVRDRRPRRPVRGACPDARAGARGGVARGGGRIASRIEGATLVMVPGRDLMPWFGDLAAVFDAMRMFLGVAHPPSASHRFVATVLSPISSARRSERPLSVTAPGGRRWPITTPRPRAARLIRGARAGLRWRWLLRGIRLSGRCHPLRRVDRRGGRRDRARDPSRDHTGECHDADGKVGGMAVSIRRSGRRIGRTR